MPDILLTGQSLPGGSEESLQHPLQGKLSVTSGKSRLPPSPALLTGELEGYLPPLPAVQGNWGTRAGETIPGHLHTGTEE